MKEEEKTPVTETKAFFENIVNESFDRFIGFSEQEKEAFKKHSLIKKHENVSKEDFKKNEEAIKNDVSQAIFDIGGNKRISEHLNEYYDEALEKGIEVHEVKGDDTHEAKGEEKKVEQKIDLEKARKAYVQKVFNLIDTDKHFGELVKDSDKKDKTTEEIEELKANQKKAEEAALKALEENIKKLFDEQHRVYGGKPSNAPENKDKNLADNPSFGEKVRAFLASVLKFMTLGLVNIKTMGASKAVMKETTKLIHSKGKALQIKDIMNRPLKSKTETELEKKESASKKEISLK